MSNSSGALGLTFTDFLAKMKDPAAADLVRQIKSFIRRFEERPPGHEEDPEADSAQVQAFLAQAEQQFRQHPVWRGCQPEVLDQAVEGLEKYVMSKVFRQTFGVWHEDRERDERYQRLMQALGFVDLPTLMGAPIEPDTNMLALAQAELLKMDRYKAPRDKLLCLVNVKTMVENIVQLAASKGANIGGADAFFPVFLFVVIRSRMPHLAANVEYVKRFRSRSRLLGQFDYMLANLESAAMYLDTVDYQHLAVSQEQFLAHLAAAGIPEAHLELRRVQQQQQPSSAVCMAREVGTVPSEQSPPIKQHPEAYLGSDDTRCVARLQPGMQPDLGSEPHLLDDGGDQSDLLGASTPPRIVASMEGDAGLDGAAVGGDGGSAGALTPLDGPPAHTPTPIEFTAQGDLHESSTMSGQPFLVPDEHSVVAAEVGGGQHAPQQLQDPAAQTVQHASLAQLHPMSSPLVEQLVADGYQGVLAAELAGHLQQQYPYLYSQAGDLSLIDVQGLLAGYKQLILRYEALVCALRQQLGVGEREEDATWGAVPRASEQVTASTLHDAESANSGRQCAQTGLSGPSDSPACDLDVVAAAEGTAPELTQSSLQEHSVASSGAAASILEQQGSVVDAGVMVQESLQLPQAQVAAAASATEASCPYLPAGAGDSATAAALLDEHEEAGATRAAPLPAGSTLFSASCHNIST